MDCELIGPGDDNVRMTSGLFLKVNKKVSDLEPRSSAPKSQQLKFCLVCKIASLITIVILDIQNTHFFNLNY
jgi:hypothetical protein